jgi:hypothetical protein
MLGLTSPVGLRLHPRSDEIECERMIMLYGYCWDHPLLYNCSGSWRSGRSYPEIFNKEEERQKMAGSDEAALGPHM